MNAAYEELERRHERMAAINGAMSILGWDRLVMMPDGGAPSRARQISTLAVIAHEMQTAPDMGDLIERAEDADGLDDWQRANLREIRHGWLHATAVPADLIEREVKLGSEAEMTWREARADNEFSALAPRLQALLEVVREIAAAKAQALGCDPYDALLDVYDPEQKSADIDRLFDDLLDFLPNLLDEVLERQAAQPEIVMPEGPFRIDVQEALGRHVMELLGFDFAGGRLDVSHHPFSGGTADDSRITTRYDDGDFTQSLMGVIHETGHAQYERGLPEEWRGQPVGRSRGMAIHESQSLLLEMLVARSPEFITHIAPQLRERFRGEGPAWSDDNLVRLYHRVERGPIRVDADEVTYPLHVILRYRLERDMIAGRMQAVDLPEAWNEGMREFVGIVPDDDAEGCMQDIHWPSGAFGYFPTYTLGALGASQIFAAARASEPDILTGIGRGTFAPLLAWLRENIHGRGCRYMPEELMKKATGEPLGTAAFKAHLEARYLDA